MTQPRERSSLTTKLTPRPCMTLGMGATEPSMRRPPELLSRGASVNGWHSFLSVHPNQQEDPMRDTSKHHTPPRTQRQSAERSRHLPRWSGAFAVLVAILSASIPALGAGNTTHVIITKRAVDRIQDPALRALMQGHTEQWVNGSVLPDSGYTAAEFETKSYPLRLAVYELEKITYQILKTAHDAAVASYDTRLGLYYACLTICDEPEEPGPPPVPPIPPVQFRQELRDWSEHMHWPAFHSDYYSDLQEACGDLTTPRCQARVAHFMGVISHGVADEAWDALLLKQQQLEDGPPDPSSARSPDAASSFLVYDDFGTDTALHPTHSHGVTVHASAKIEGAMLPSA